jgi:hypothetical protein
MQQFCEMRTMLVSLLVFVMLTCTLQGANAASVFNSHRSGQSGSNAEQLAASKSEDSLQDAHDAADVYYPSESSASQLAAYDFSAPQFVYRRELGELEPIVSPVAQPMMNKRAQTFVRFGKRAQTFVRFGKRAQTFVRFG